MTKTGDAGMSGLANGDRLIKSDQIFMVLGDFDELNSWLGLIISKLVFISQDRSPEVAKIIQFQISLLELTQAWIYEASAILAKSPNFKIKIKPLMKLEAQANQLQLALGENWHKRFLYPGGTEMAGYLDIVRTVARRTERSLVLWLQLTNQTEINPAVPKIILPTFNRLSDYLYILRCWLNDQAQVAEKQFGKT